MTAVRAKRRRARMTIPDAKHRTKTRKDTDDEWRGGDLSSRLTGPLSKTGVPLPLFQLIVLIGRKNVVTFAKVGVILL